MSKDVQLDTKCPVCNSDLFARVNATGDGPINCFKTGATVGWLDEWEETYSPDWGTHTEDGPYQDWSMRNGAEPC